MTDPFEPLLMVGRGAFGRDDALRIASRHALDNEVKFGALVAVFPRAYVRPWDVDHEPTRLRAALASVGGDVALSHLSALKQRELPVPADAPIHIKAYQARHPRGRPGELVVHRTLLPLNAVLLDGLPTVDLESALIDSWPLASGSAQRAPIIEAYRRRLIRPDRLRAAADTMGWTPGISAARELIGLVLDGCESELELWGYTDVFVGPEFADARRQVRVQVGDQWYRLDLVLEPERLNIELDGRKYHAGTAQWERDIARDRAVARVGYQTLRFSHDHLHTNPAGCRAEALDVRAWRRRMLGAA